MQPLVIVLVIIGLATVAVLAYRADRKRRVALRAWARRRSFTLTRERKVGWEKEYPAFKLFDRGRHRHTSLHLEGESNGHRVRCVDYRYTTGSGKNRRTHRYGIVVLNTDNPVIPLCIRREHVFDRVGEFFGHDDLDFESSEFSRRFHVSSSDRKWAYDVIHQRTIDYLLEAPSVTIEFGVAEIAVYHAGALTADRCQEGIDVTQHMLDLVPDSVLAELRGESS